MKRAFVWLLTLSLLPLLTAFRWPWQAADEPERIEWSGTVEAREVDLAFQVSGRIAGLAVDEGGDPVSRRAFWRLLNGVRAEGVAILYAAANMDEAERCDRVGLLNAGRLERQDTSLELTRNANAQLVGVSGPTARRRDALLAWPMMQLVFPVGRQLRVWLDVGGSLTEFQLRLGALDAELTAQSLQPTLQDAALRELAMAEVKLPGGVSARTD